MVEHLLAIGNSNNLLRGVVVGIASKYRVKPLAVRCYDIPHTIAELAVAAEFIGLCFELQIDVFFSD